MSLNLPEPLRWLAWIAGASWPDGDEDKAWAVSRAWEAASKGLEGQISGIEQSKSAAMAAFPAGDAADAIGKLFDAFLSGDQSLETLAKSFKTVSDSTNDVGTETQSGKLNIIISLAVLAMEIAWAWLFPPTAPAVEAAAITTTRSFVKFLSDTIQNALERAWAKLGFATRAELNNATGTASRYWIKHILSAGTWQSLKGQSWKFAAKTLLPSAKGMGVYTLKFGEGAVLSGGLNAAVQGGQIAAGHRKSFNWTEFGASLAGTAAGTLPARELGRYMGFGFSSLDKAFGNKITNAPFRSGFLGTGAIVGATTGVTSTFFGAIGAGLVVGDVGGALSSPQGWVGGASRGAIVGGARGVSTKVTKFDPNIPATNPRNDPRFSAWMGKKGLFAMDKNAPLPNGNPLVPRGPGGQAVPPAGGVRPAAAPANAPVVPANPANPGARPQVPVNPVANPGANPGGRPQVAAVGGNVGGANPGARPQVVPGGAQVGAAPGNGHPVGVAVSTPGNSAQPAAGGTRVPGNDGSAPRPPMATATGTNGAGPSRAPIVAQGYGGAAQGGGGQRPAVNFSRPMPPAGAAPAAGQGGGQRPVINFSRPIPPGGAAPAVGQGNAGGHGAAVPPPIPGQGGGQRPVINFSRPIPPGGAAPAVGQGNAGGHGAAVPPPNRPVPPIPGQGNVAPPPNRPAPAIPGQGNVAPPPPNRPAPAIPGQGNVAPPPNPQPAQQPPANFGHQANPNAERLFGPGKDLRGKTRPKREPEIEKLPPEFHDPDAPDAQDWLDAVGFTEGVTTTDTGDPPDDGGDTSPDKAFEL